VYDKFKLNFRKFVQDMSCTQTFEKNLIMQKPSFLKINIALSLMVAVVLLTGCPYSSSVPVDDGSVKIPAMLEGKWISTADLESENPSYFVITITDKFHALATKLEYSSSDSSYAPTNYELTLSDVDGEIFMNAKEQSGSNYNLYKFSVDETKNEIYTTELSDYIKETFSSSKELKSFISKNKGNSYFYTNTSENYVRK
jgi:hypothetical protein